MRESRLAANEVASAQCLNCGADLAGAFCGACGQRAVPADPTVGELAGDAWHELSGYDGRIATTFRTLLRPGRLTLDYLQGRRARYLSPVRFYLTASVIYFLIAAAAPADARRNPGEVTGPGNLRLGIWGGAPGQVLTEEDRKQLETQIAEAPWFVRIFLQSLSKDPEGFRSRLFTIMPRVFFGMLPVFAGIVWLFYRRRRFPTALVFAVHLHAFAFLVFAVSEAAKFARSATVSVIVGLPLIIGFAAYALLAQKTVFGGRWPITVVKAAGIGFVYMLAAVPAFLIILLWASIT